MGIDADRLNEIRSELNSPLPNDRIGGVLKLRDEAFLLAALDAAEQRAEGVDRVTKRMRAAEARAVQAEQDLVAWKVSADVATAALGKRAEQAEQERDEARRDRDNWKGVAHDASDKLFNQATKRRAAVRKVEAAEARATKATNALSDLVAVAAHFVDTDGRGDIDGQLDRCRAVLADLATEEKP